jgi:hypothetical protein
VADYRILLEADTAKAEKDLRRVETVADTATRTRKLNIELPSIAGVQKSFNNLKDGVEGAANNVRQFYQVSKVIPQVGERVQKVEDAFKGTGSAIRGAMDIINRNSSAGDILANGLNTAAKAGGTLLNNLSKVGFALFGLKEVVGILQGAFGELFNQTIGREIALRETLLKAQTNVASMSDVYVGNRKIEDPLEKIKALTNTIEQNVDSIRERSLELAGVTSNEVVEVFGIVAGQIGQVGGSLKDAEDLAISFAAALGTFGLPIQQARQEITSLMQGNVGADSYLARALGITNSDIQKARTQTGGVIAFVQKKLETAVAGQKLAAQSFSGITSNIRELGELIGQKFGRGLLDPLLAGLTKVYQWASAIKDQLYAMAEGAGKTLGNISRIAAVRISTAVTAGTSFATDSGALNALKQAGELAQRIASNVFATLGRVATTTIAAIVQVITALRPSIALVAEAFGRLIKAFAELQVGKFQTLVSVVANLVSAIGPAISALAGFFNIWSRILDLPIFQYMSEVAVVLGLLKRAGLDAALTFVSLGGFIMSTAVPAIVKIGIAVGGFIGTLGLLVVALAKVALSIAAMAGAFLAPAAAIPALQAGLVQFIGSMQAAGAAAQQTGTQLNVLGAGMQGLGASAKAMGMALVTSLGKFALIQIGIAVLIDLFGRFQRAQQEAASRKEAAEALKFLEQNAKGASGGLDEVNQRLYDYKKALAETRAAELVKGMSDIDKQIRELEGALEGGKKGMEGFLHFLRWGGGGMSDVYRKKILALKGDKEKLRLEMEKILEAMKKQAAEAARAEANSPKGRIEQLQKEEKARQTLVGLQQQELKNSINQLQLYGQISEKESKRREALAEISNLSSEISEKQKLLAQIKLIDPKNTEEITKVRGEIAQLEGKKVQIEIQVKKEAFEQFVQNLERTTTIRTNALNLESQVLQNNLSIDQARANAEQGRLNYILQGLQAAKENARSDIERIAIATRIAAVQKQIADNEYRGAIASIEAGIRQAQIQVEIVRIKEAELRVVIATARAQGLLTDAHLDALRAGQQSVRLAQDNLRTVTASAAYQKQAAEWTRQGAYMQANLALNAERTAKAQQRSADQTQRQADQLQRAAGIQLQGFSNLEPWMEAKIAEAKNAAIQATRFQSAWTSYIAGVNAELKMRTQFEQVMQAQRAASNTQAESSFWTQAASLGFGKFASGGYVTSPTLGLIGEAGESEFVIPESKMGAASARYLSGQRGASVLSGGSTGGASGEPTINISTGPVLEFDGQRYITISDFERGLRTTATSVLNALRTPAARLATGIR